MGKFILKVIIPTMIIVLFIFVGLEIYLRNLPNDFKSKAEYMEEHAGDIKILVLGSSGASMGIKPSCFSHQPSYSCAYANQSTDYNLLILQKYLDRMDSLRYLILDAQYASPWWRLEDQAQTFVKKYVIYYKLDGYNGFENNFEISASIRDLIGRVFHLSDREAFTTCDNDGFQSRYFINIPYDDQQWKDYGEEHCKEHTIYNRKKDGGEVYWANYEKLRAIIMMCKEHGVNVLFVSTPCHPYYYNYYDENQYAIFYDTYSGLSKKYDNVKWLDYTRSDEFNSDDMSNICHLNTQGATKLTRMLNDSIKKWGD